MPSILPSANGVADDERVEGVQAAYRRWRWVLDFFRDPVACLPLQLHGSGNVRIADGRL